MLCDRFPAYRVLRSAELLVSPLRLNYQGQDLTQLHFCLVEDSDFALILVHLKTRFLFVAGSSIRVLNCHGLSHCFDTSGRADTLEQIEALLEGPWTQVSLWCALFAHLLPFILDVPRCALLAAHLDHLLRYGLP